MRHRNLVSTAKGRLPVSRATLPFFKRPPVLLLKRRQASKLLLMLASHASTSSSCGITAQPVGKRSPMPSVPCLPRHARPRSSRAESQIDLLRVAD
jgi:hypothetical protein